MAAPHPVQLRINDDLGRSRLTVFFRLLLALPHIVWLLLWTIVALLVAVVNWFATLITGRPPRALHRFLAAYTRYAIHVNAYIFLAANPFPGFTGRPGSYPIDLELGEPPRQNRWLTLFRIFLAVPAIFIAGSLVGSGGFGIGRIGGAFLGAFAGGMVATLAFLSWFASLVRGREQQGLRDAMAYALRYAGQLDAYIFCLTDRYPTADPRTEGTLPDDVHHPVRVALTDDGTRSRLTVFFRLLLTLPHLVWLVLWGFVAALTAIVNWVATLVLGRAPAELHRFLSAYVRYQAHVAAYLFLITNPFPGFTGKRGSYPLDVDLPEPARQNRWLTLFRLFLAVPAWLISGALSSLLFTAGLLGWFASLVTARMPLGLRNAGAYALRYSAQVSAYGWFLLTDRYPYSGPLAHEP